MEFLLHICSCICISIFSLQHQYNNYTNLNTIDPFLVTTEEQYTPLHYAAYYVPPYEVETVGAEQTDAQELLDHLASSKKAMEFLMSVPGIDVSFHQKLIIIIGTICKLLISKQTIHNIIIISIIYHTCTSKYE